MFKSEDCKKIVAKVEELRIDWNQKVSQFHDKDNIRKLTGKYSNVSMDLEDMTISVTYETDWDDDFHVCSIDVAVDDREIDDVLEDIESEIARSFEHIKQRDEDYRVKKERWDANQKQQRLEQYKRLQAEFGQISTPM